MRASLPTAPPEVFVLVTLLAASGCEGAPSPREAGPPIDAVGALDAGAHDAAPTDGSIDASVRTCFEPIFGTGRSPLTIDEAVAGGGCSTAIVRPLSEQLIAEVECLEPGTMARIDGIPGLALTSTALPWLQVPAAGGLADAIADMGGTLSVNSTLRTLPQQLLLYRWYRAGLCGITLAASPGTSPHESGLAIDTSQYTAWRGALERHGWRWHGAGDVVHFDYVAGGVRLEGLSVLAFQRLWNRNHPEDVIAEDGLYGPQTEARLRSSPAEGFPIGAVCDAVDDAFAVRWDVDAEGYLLRAEPPMGTERVAFAIDGREVGQASRADGFALRVGGCADDRGHTLIATARDADGVPLASRSAYVEGRASDALFVQPREGATFEIGIERPDPSIVAIEVDVDGFALTDEVSGEVRSSRRAITRTFTTLGERNVVLRAYDDAGSVRVMREARVPLEVTP
ncbi:MAG: hypothetical protein OHK0013_42600 [Sandaracinaceae bacterium]